ncbi:hypothetical protein Y032_0025g1203 [Ancylostoma ceylanicum]|uniref:Uncharacterized protein n=1 Tax=Ancylostoma ceylanicum TaxID=53326 RepID=A0A016UVW8_9BILA|nr:hypothetical protein Y032_0025g1203 [Ancylostoma ceylanicum]
MLVEFFMKSLHKRISFYSNIHRSNFLAKTRSNFLAEKVELRRVIRAKRCEAVQLAQKERGTRVRDKTPQSCGLGSMFCSRMWLSFLGFFSARKKEQILLV